MLSLICRRISFRIERRRRKFRDRRYKTNAKQNDVIGKTLKDKLNEDLTLTFNHKAAHHENTTHKKLKLPPVSKILLSTNKRKEIRRQIKFNIT